jgi:ribosomal protein S16
VWVIKRGVCAARGARVFDQERDNHSVSCRYWLSVGADPTLTVSKLLGLVSIIMI